MVWFQSEKIKFEWSRFGPGLGKSWRMVWWKIADRNETKPTNIDFFVNKIDCEFYKFSSKNLIFVSKNSHGLGLVSVSKFDHGLRSVWSQNSVQKLVWSGLGLSIENTRRFRSPNLAQRTTLLQKIINIGKCENRGEGTKSDGELNRTPLCY